MSGDEYQWETSVNGQQQGGKSFGWDEDTFMFAYRHNVQSSYVDSLETSTFTSAIVKMFESEPNFTGTALNLLEQLETYANDKAVRSRKWVTTAKGVMVQLYRHQEALEVKGIYFERTRDRTNKTIVTLTKDKEFTEEEVDLNSQTDDEWISEYKFTEVS